MTPDREAAKAFYGALFGWSAEDLELGYTAFLLDGVPVGGAITLSPEQQSAGARPAWTTYVRVADVDAAVALVAELGGTLIGPVFDIAGVGRGAAFADRQGAVLQLWEAHGVEGAELVNEIGAWTWNDLQTPDPAGAVPFYEALFGWTFSEIPESHGRYFAIGHEGRTIGGLMRATETPRPFWAVYFGVASADAALEQTAAAGGRGILGPIPVPAGRFAIAADPHGAVFGVVEGTFDD